MAENSKPLKGELIPPECGAFFVPAIPKSNPAFDRESLGEVAIYATRYVQEFVARVYEICSDSGQIEEQKRAECERLFNLCCHTSSMLFNLAIVFPEVFKSIARERPIFPCLFPVHSQLQASLKQFLLEQLDLGSQLELKLRAPRGRKTFSFEPEVNRLLFHYITRIYSIRFQLLSQRLANPSFLNAPLSAIERLDDEVPLTPANASPWIDEIWKLLLRDIPKPEEHPVLRSLGNRRSRTERAGTTWSPRVTKGTQARKRTPRQFGSNRGSYARAAIKDGLRKYLVRMLRQQSADK